MSDADQIIAIIPKNSNEETRVALSTFNGHRLAAVRVYFHPAGSADGTMLPGKAGINIRVEQVPALIEALQELAARAGVA